MLKMVNEDIVGKVTGRSYWIVKKAASQRTVINDLIIGAGPPH